MTNNLPQGWVECELKDLLDLQNGYAFSSKDYVKKSNTLNIRMSNIRPNGVFDETHNIKYLPDDYVNKYKDYILKNGDLIIAMTDMADNSKILGVPTVVSYRNNKHVFLMNQRVGRLISFSNNVYIPFIKLILISPKVRSIYKSKGKGGLQLNLSKNDILSMEIILPPLNEQKRIVEKIEEEFAKIDEGVEKLELAQEQIVQYKQSVLKSAFEGKLYKTSEWGEDNIEGITSKIVGGGTPSKNIAKYYDGDIPFMTVKDMTSFRPDDTEWHITQEAIANSSTNLIPKDTIIIATRVGLGKIVRLNFDTAINQDLKALILNNNIDKDFCEFLLQYKTPEIIFKGRGTTVKGITLEELKNINFKLPTLDEQKQITKEIEKRFKVADEAEKVITNNLEKAQQLKQSILKKAFEGRLVPQDPNDEPASVLLEKIKTERGK